MSFRDDCPFKVEVIQNVFHLKSNKSNPKKKQTSFAIVTAVCASKIGRTERIKPEVVEQKQRSQVNNRSNITIICFRMINHWFTLWLCILRDMMLDYHTKMGTQIRVNESIVKSDLLSRVFRDRLSQGDNLTARVENEIIVIECRHQHEGKWVYNCVYDYWKRIKGRFLLLAPVAQQVLQNLF